MSSIRTKRISRKRSRKSSHKHSSSKKSSSTSSKKSSSTSSKKSSSISSKKSTLNELNQCINLLKHPNPRINTPLSCYKILEFPNQPRDKRIKPGPYHQFFEKLIGKSKLLILDHIIDIEKIFKSSNKSNSKSNANSNKSKFNINILINKQIKKSIRYLLIPVYFSTTNNYYGILYDKREKEIEFFVQPGSIKEKNDKDLELKFREFLIDQLKLPIEYFYYNISNAPRPDTYHADFWASWLIYQKIKKSLDRELLVNYALEKVLRNSDDYAKFTNKFTEFILSK